MSRERLPFLLFAAGLALAGLLLAFLRHDRLGIPFQPDVSRPVWLVEARIDFVARGNAVRVSLDLPDNPPGFLVFAEQAASPGYGFSITRQNERRRGEWTRQEPTGKPTPNSAAQYPADPTAAASKPAMASEPQSAF